MTKSVSFIGKRPDHRPKTKTPSLQEREAASLRSHKRMLKKMGLIADRYPIQWVWTQGKDTGTVEAFTKSEAKARIKEELGISKSKRLPTDVLITKAEGLE